MIEEHGSELRVHRQANAVLWRAISADPGLRAQAQAVFEGDFADCTPDFLGFVGTYRLLALLIPRDRVVYDCGCGHAFQSWFFRRHRRYVGIDLDWGGMPLFSMPNCEFHRGGLAEFVRSAKVESPHFAICNYVPPWGQDNQALVRKTFEHLFVYYP